MGLSDSLWRSWNAFRIPLWVATGLSILSLLSLTDQPSLEWLGWFGAPGVLFLFGTDRFSTDSTLGIRLALSVIANIGFLAVIIFCAMRLVNLFRRRHAIAR